MGLFSGVKFMIITMSIFTYLILGFTLASFFVYKDMKIEDDNMITIIVVTLFWPICGIVAIFAIIGGAIKTYGEFLDSAARKKRQEKSQAEDEERRRQYEQREREEEEQEKRERAEERRRKARARARRQARLKTSKPIVVKSTKKLSVPKNEPLKNRLDTVD